MRPPEYQRPFDVRSARRFFLRLAIVVVILLAAFQSISFYVDSLWFASLGFEPVYWYRLRAEATVFLAFAVASALVLWLLFRLVMPPAGYSRRPFLQPRPEGQQRPVEPDAARRRGRDLQGLYRRRRRYPGYQHLQLQRHQLERARKTQRDRGLEGAGLQSGQNYGLGLGRSAFAGSRERIGNERNRLRCFQCSNGWHSGVSRQSSLSGPFRLPLVGSPGRWRHGDSRQPPPGMVRALCQSRRGICQDCMIP